ncbi:precorrin-2 dehydrogenase/sirohydrochlorin ferrochelatase family protein, partial [Cronobacter dublinensis]
MEYLPLFAQLKQRPVLVVGGGEVALRKIALLRRAGACVCVVAKKLHPELAALEQEGALRWLAQTFEPSQLDAVFLVIAATNDEALNRRVFDEANARQRLVNVVDDQPLCSFIFPSIVDRSPLIVAISSSGNAPVLARLLREKIESLLPASLGRMAGVAGGFRDRIKARIPTTDGRRRFWEKAFRGRFASLMAAGDTRA